MTIGISLCSFARHSLASSSRCRHRALLLSSMLCSVVSAGLASTLTDTTQSDFQAGVATSVDLTTSAGDVKLSDAAVLDQANTAGTTTGTGLTTASWGGQTFIPSVSGQLTTVEFQIFASGITGTPPDIRVSLRATSAGLPTGADLASGTIPGFTTAGTASYSVTFASPASVTSGTQYALILRPVTVPATGGYFAIRSSPSTYASGQRVFSGNGGVSWTADSTRDFNFKIYIQNGYATSGDLVSNLKDADPAAAGFTYTSWNTLSWTATVPASTSLKFQGAASNSSTGPFNFVGPDGTAATFYTSTGADLSQFSGNRYFQYKAFLATSDTSATPTLSDVTIAYTNTNPDSTAPTIASIVRLTPAAQTSTDGTTSFTFRVTYSESVQNVTTAQFSVEAVNGSNITGTVASVSGTGATRDVAVTITGGTGEFRLKALD